MEKTVLAGCLRNVSNEVLRRLVVKIFLCLLGTLGVIFWSVYVLVPLLEAVQSTVPGNQPQLSDTKEIYGNLSEPALAITGKEKIRNEGLHDEYLEAVTSNVNESLEIKLRLEKSLREQVLRQLEPLTGVGRVQVSVFVRLKSLIEEGVTNDKLSGEIERLSISLLLGRRPVAADEGEGLGAGYDEWSTWEQGQIEQLVKSAVGFNATRGDVLKMAVLPLESDRTSFSQPELLTILQTARDSNEGGVIFGLPANKVVIFLWGSLGFLLLLALSVSVLVKTGNTEDNLLEKTGRQTGVQGGNQVGTGMGYNFDLPRPRPLTARSTTSKDALSVAKEDPRSTAQILDEWLS